MFTFAWPLFILLLPLPLLLSMRRPGSASPYAGPILRFPHLEALRAAYGSSDGLRLNRWAKLLPWALYLAWGCLVLALMRPQNVDRLSTVQNNGHDLMLAVDLSGSMQSLDFSQNGERVSRLDVAKNVVKDFVQKRAGDRIGLVLFGEHAFLQTPLTSDTQTVSKMLDNAVPGMAGDSTAIGDAIGLAVKTIRSLPAASRAIVLLTDGEDNSSTLPPLQAAELARQYGIQVYTIVIGKEGIVPFPDGHGGIAMVESQVDTTLTRKIAQLTGGEFYRATDAKALARIYDRIDALQKSESDSRVTWIRKPLYQIPLGFALVLLFLIAAAAQIRRPSYEPFAI